MPATIIATPSPIEVDLLPQCGREAAICELDCSNCGYGMKFDDECCPVCSVLNQRYQKFTGNVRRELRFSNLSHFPATPTMPEEFDPARPMSVKSIG